MGVPVDAENIHEGGEYSGSLQTFGDGNIASPERAGRGYADTMKSPIQAFFKNRVNGQRMLMDHDNDDFILFET